MRRRSENYEQSREKKTGKKKQKEQQEEFPVYRNACGQSYERKSKQKALKNAMKAMEDVYADVEQIYKQAVNIANTYKSLIDGNEEDVADFPKRDAFRRWR